MLKKPETAAHDAPPGTPNSGACACAWVGCNSAGAYRAPKDRSLTAYFTFCLEHVRAYNAKWDYHAGCSAAELEAEIRGAVTWERPTWKLGTLGGGSRFQPGRARVHDPFGFTAGTAFNPGGETWDGEREPHRRGGTQAPRDLAHLARVEALKVMDLAAPLTLEGLRRRYKLLVKKHHPDANGGSPEAETRMKVINQAYQTLRASLGPNVE